MIKNDLIIIERIPYVDEILSHLKKKKKNKKKKKKVLPKVTHLYP